MNVNGLAEKTRGLLREDFLSDLKSTSSGDSQGHTETRSLLREMARLEKMTFQELKEKWRELFDGREPPRCKRDFLFRRIVYRVQANVYGDIPDETIARMDRLLEEEGYDEIGRKVKPRVKTPPPALTPGTIITREYSGETHVVTVLPGGNFEYRSLPFKSLSAVARHITGARWNGPAWFGLRGGKGKAKVITGGAK